MKKTNESIFASKKENSEIFAFKNQEIKNTEVLSSLKDNNEVVCNDSYKTLHSHHDFVLDSFESKKKSYNDFIKNTKNINNTSEDDKKINVYDILGLNTITCSDEEKLEAEKFEELVSKNTDFFKEIIGCSNHHCSD